MTRPPEKIPPKLVALAVSLGLPVKPEELGKPGVGQLVHLVECLRVGLRVDRAADTTAVPVTAEAKRWRERAYALRSAARKFDEPTDSEGELVGRVMRERERDLAGASAATFVLSEVVGKAGGLARVADHCDRVADHCDALARDVGQRTGNVRNAFRARTGGSNPVEMLTRGLAAALRRHGARVTHETLMDAAQVIWTVAFGEPPDNSRQRSRPSSRLTHRPGDCSRKSGSRSPDIRRPRAVSTTRRSPDTSGRCIARHAISKCAEQPKKTLLSRIF